MRNRGYVAGEWNVICDRCGFKKFASELRLEWTGFRVCSDCFEHRHPQDFLPAPRPETLPPWTRPEHTDTEIVVPYVEIAEFFCSAEARLCHADYGRADCMTVEVIIGGLVQ